MTLQVEPDQLYNEASKSETLADEAPSLRVQTIADEIKREITGGTSGAAALSAAEYLDKALCVSEEDLHEYAGSLRDSAILVQEQDQSGCQDFSQLESAVAAEMGNDPTGTVITPSLDSAPTERTQETGRAGTYYRTPHSEGTGNTFATAARGLTTGLGSAVDAAVGDAAGRAAGRTAAGRTVMCAARCTAGRPPGPGHPQPRQAR